MITYNNKIVKHQNGKILKPWVFPPLVFECRYRYPFAYVSSGTPHDVGHFTFTSSVPNTIYIDHNDGSGIKSANFTNSIDIHKLASFNKDFGTAAVRHVKIWFKIPSKITGFSMLLVTLHGDFPKGLSFYSIRRLLLNPISYFNPFLEDFPPSYLQKLIIDQVLNTQVIGIPEWILKSRIQILVLGNGINLSNPSTNKLERVINIKDIETFFVLGYLADVASNFKDIPTLRCINISSSTEITQNINNCKQITMLWYSYTNPFGDRGSSATGGISSWGVGIGGMSLTSFSCHYATGCPTTLPTGLKECPSITLLGMGNCFQTVSRMNEFINNAYDTITQGASMAVGASPLRKIRLELVINGLGARPSGTYQQPSGYIQGVSNGTPVSQMEKVWVIVKQYKWVIYIKSAAVVTSSETLS